MFRTLRGRTALLIALALAPGFLALWREFRAEHEAGVRAAHEEIRRLALHAAEQQARTIDAARGLLAAFAEARSVLERDATHCGATAEALLARLPFISNLGAAAPDGETFCHAVPVRGRISIADRLYFRRALAQRSFSVGEYQVSRARNVQAINFGYPSIGERGEVRAVVFVGVSTQHITEQLRSLALPAGGAAFVTDHEGRVLAGTGVPTGELLGGPLADWLRSDPAGLAVLPGPDGVRRLFASETLRSPAGDPGLRIAVGIEPRRAYAKADEARRRALALFGVGGLASVVLLAYAANVLLVRRLEALGSAARRIARGDYTARTGLPRTPDELGQLARDFDEMADSLDAITRQHRLVLECAGDGIIGVDLGGKITFANPAAARLLALAESAGLGRSIHDFLPSHAPALAPASSGCAVCDAMALGDVRSVADVRIVREDGNAFAAECVATPTLERGRIVGSVLTLKDVTARRRLEEHLRQSQKMEAVGQLAGGVAHDFNNMLTAIIGAGEFARGALEDHPAKGDVEDMLGAARRAADLTRRLLAFSRRQVTQPAILDLGEVLATTGAILRRLLGEDVKLELDRGSAPCPVRADPSLVEQAIVNLAVNARDAMPRGGRLRMSVRPVGADDAVVRQDPGIPIGPLVELSVVDEGQGMDSATRARVFEPFFTTKAPGRGTGLGLSTVYAVVQQAGGVVRVESAPGRGTTFRIYLPRAAEEPARPMPAAPQAAIGTETILVVEDDPGVRSIVERVLGSAGYRVLTATGPETARKAAAGPERPALLLTDVILADGSGPELARELTGADPGLRVLYMSGYTGGRLDERGVGGAVDFLQKPFTAATLLARVRGALDAAKKG